MASESLKPYLVIFAAFKDSMTIQTIQGHRFLYH